MEPSTSKKSGADVFWGEVASFDHLLQIYENNNVFLDTLAEFISSGLHSGDSNIVIATPEHIEELEKRLQLEGFDLTQARLQDLYITVDAREALTKFMVNGWPDEKLFNQFISALLMLARGKNQRKVRAFGEMVALLWAQGSCGATVRLEYLWHKLGISEFKFSLFCAYPKAGFIKNMVDSVNEICAMHTRVFS